MLIFWQILQCCSIQQDFVNPGFMPKMDANDLILLINHGTSQSHSQNMARNVYLNRCWWGCRYVCPFESRCAMLRASEIYAIYVCYVCVLCVYCILKYLPPRPAGARLWVFGPERVMLSIAPSKSIFIGLDSLHTRPNMLPIWEAEKFWTGWVLRPSWRDSWDEVDAE